MDHSLSLKQKRNLEKLNNDLGSIVLSYLSDSAITEIMLNEDGELWIDHTKKGMIDTQTNLSVTQAYQIITSVAYISGMIVNEQKQIIETELPEGSRFVAAIPPTVSKPVFCIRKHSQKVFSLEDYIEQQILTEYQAVVLRESIQAGKSILIVGGPGTGKTTFANAVLNEMVLLGDYGQRFLILEDVRELQCSAKNKVCLKINNYVDFLALLKFSLKFRPDKICIGECRGSEMLTLLKAWNTGTQGGKGLATLHANCVRSALLRIEELVKESGSAIQPHFICESVDIIVSIDIQNKKRFIHEVVELIDHRNSEYVFKILA